MFQLSMIWNLICPHHKLLLLLFGMGICPSPDPLHPYKDPDVTVHIGNPATDEVKTGGFKGCWPASLANW